MTALAAPTAYIEMEFSGILNRLRSNLRHQLKRTPNKRLHVHCFDGEQIGNVHHAARTAAATVGYELSAISPIRGLVVEVKRDSGVRLRPD